MESLIQQVIYGLSVGSIYALVALAIVLVYRSMDLINFAQGEFFMMGAFIGYLVYTQISTHFLVVLVLSTVIAFALGMLVERVFLRPLQGQDDILILLVMTIALFIILPSLALLIFGPQAFVLPPVEKKLYVIGGIALNPQYLIILLITLVIMAALYLMFTRTHLGISLRAVAENKESARMMGLNVSFANSLTFGLAAALGAIAGVTYAPLIVITFDMGGVIMLKGFTAAVIGGLEIIPGAVLGGLVLGLIEQFSTLFISSAYKDMISFGLLLFIILVRPNGLLGRRKVTKV